MISSGKNIYTKISRYLHKILEPHDMKLHKFEFQSCTSLSTHWQRRLRGASCTLPPLPPPATQGRRNQRAGGQLPPQIFAKQLTLFQPWRQIMLSTFLLAPSDFQTFLCHIQQHQHQLQLARPALFIFSFRPKNLAEVIVRHCQSTVSVTSKARDLGIEQRHISYSQRPEQNSDLKKQKISSIKFSIFHLISYVKNLASSLFLVVKVENISEDSLNLIPSGKTLLGDVNKLFLFK